MISMQDMAQHLLRIARPPDGMMVWVELPTDSIVVGDASVSFKIGRRLIEDHLHEPYYLRGLSFLREAIAEESRAAHRWANLASIEMHQ